MLFHLDKSWFPGGFVGVDVFFVISGYLITSIIYRGNESGDFSLLEFYQRRVARIFPVFFLVTFATLFAAAFIYQPQDFSSAGAVSVASVLSFANVKLMMQGDYFDVSADAQPFLHFWSLSVEEQYYLLLPVFLVLCHKRKLGKKSLLLVLWAIFFTSLVACIYLTMINPVWAFYLLPTRAWELLAGGILGIYCSKTLKPSKFDQYASIVGLVLLAASLFLINETQGFPGFIALCPVVAAVLVIGRASDPNQLSEALLSGSLLVFIGKLSYSLYLWHWPIYCFVDYSMFRESGVLRGGLKILLTVVLATLSYSLIENPARKFLNQRRRKAPVAIFLCAAIVCFVIAGVIVRHSYYPAAKRSQVVSGGVHYPSSDSKYSIALIGDSNGTMYGTTVKRIAVKTRADFNILSAAAHDPLSPSGLFNDTCTFLRTCPADVTIFAAAWAEHASDDPSKIEDSVIKLLEHSKILILVTQPPVLADGVSREGIRNGTTGPATELADYAKERKRLNAYLQTLQSNRVVVINCESDFMTGEGHVKFLDSAGRQLYYDRSHLSVLGAELVGRRIERAINRTVDKIR